ncbi:MAG TPA: 30S ribosomal protein S9 [Kiritimatiellia bacterium]|nr:30S ribosomal protein S9 [Kiritimatiellia bacterium]HNR95098.1 30S ribosomal protein S9 [Kiritimatiellia bacterium]HNS80533.1 30S ribosomal protein S9 [Kiritimatiellia bacterium]HPA79144.1 30S ribosomal protein S9 [Kiritimatiellia bacterium]HQQ04049.1 30S ribosomal protein S9 [Kiritimatiellia bacterium]
MVQKVVEYAATGRRKEAVARVNMAPGVGKVSVNGKNFETYFPIESVRNFIQQPLALTDNLNRFDIAVSVKGGGSMGQAGAVRHAIARALLQVDEALKPALKAERCLTRDARMKERKKTGQPGARKRFQFSKR